MSDLVCRNSHICHTPTVGKGKDEMTVYLLAALMMLLCIVDLAVLVLLFDFLYRISEIEKRNQPTAPGEQK